MALDITKEVAQNANYSLSECIARGLKMEFGKFTPDSSWLAAGEAMSFGFTPILVLIESSGGVVFKYDYTNSKVLGYYFDYNGAADGVAIAVADAVDLSTICADTHYVAFGFM